MRRVRPGGPLISWALFSSHHCQMAGARRGWRIRRSGGGGSNACVLHYIENNQPLNDGDLVLVDAGCELECYASDITAHLSGQQSFR